MPSTMSSSADFDAAQFDAVPVEDQHVGIILAQLRQEVAGIVEKLTVMACRAQYLADRLGLGGVVIEYSYSHDGSDVKVVM
jgi:hypothetical protein